MSAVPIEGLCAELRQRRRRLLEYEHDSRDAWSADLDSYDRGLLQAAAMLEVPAPVRMAGIPLPAAEREGLESRLSAAGFDVTVSASDWGPTGPPGGDAVGDC